MAELHGRQEMEIHRYTGPLADLGYGSGWDETEFSETDIENIRKTGAVEAWYWYADVGYEGVGQILMRWEDYYEIHDCGHCSCYGPTDDLPMAFNDTLDELRDKCSGDLLKHAGPLLDMAQAANDG